LFRHGFFESPSPAVPVQLLSVRSTRPSC